MVGPSVNPPPWGEMFWIFWANPPLAAKPPPTTELCVGQTPPFWAKPPPSNQISLVTQGGFCHNGGVLEKCKINVIMADMKLCSVHL